MNPMKEVAIDYTSGKMSVFYKIVASQILEVRSR
jgi:hypothetical protein